MEKISLELLEKEGRYKGFALSPDSNYKIVKFYELNNKIYEVYLHNYDEKESDKIVEVK
ncbi:MAG: hypothetical protein J6S67_05980 [Methanobrevibacter sp.]|nr:hypothetical protein [Methanobrevibacter sp.]